MSDGERRWTFRAVVQQSVENVPDDDDEEENTATMGGERKG